MVNYRRPANWVPAAPLVKLIEQQLADTPCAEKLNTRAGEIEFQARFGVTYRTLHRWKHDAYINIYSADRICTHLGLTFWNVWPADQLAPTG